MLESPVEVALRLALDGSRGAGAYESKTDAQLAKIVAKRAKVTEAAAGGAVKAVRQAIVDAERIANELRDGKKSDQDSAIKALRKVAPALSADQIDSLFAAGLRWSAF